MTNARWEQLLNNVTMEGPCLTMSELHDIKEFLRDVRDNWDCDEGAHGVHASHCRCCAAKKLLPEPVQPYAEPN